MMDMGTAGAATTPVADCITSLADAYAEHVLAVIPGAAEIEGMARALSGSFLAFLCEASEALLDSTV